MRFEVLSCVSRQIFGRLCSASRRATEKHKFRNVDNVTIMGNRCMPVARVSFEEIAICKRSTTLDRREEFEQSIIPDHQTWTNRRDMQKKNRPTHISWSSSKSLKRANSIMRLHSIVLTCERQQRGRRVRVRARLRSRYQTEGTLWPPFPGGGPSPSVSAAIYKLFQANKGLNLVKEIAYTQA